MLKVERVVVLAECAEESHHVHVSGQQRVAGALLPGRSSQAIAAGPHDDVTRLTGLLTPRLLLLEPQLLFSTLEILLETPQLFLRRLDSTY